MNKRTEVKFWLCDDEGMIEELQFLSVIAQAADLFSGHLDKAAMARVANWFHAKYGDAAH